MSGYRWTICEPDNPTVIDKGMIRKEDIMEVFEQFPWIDRLRKIAGMKESDVCFSPSLEFENTDTGQGVTFSIIGTEEQHEFYIFYKRPKQVKVFGLFKKQMNNYLSDILGQTKEDAVQFLKAFLENNNDYLEEKMKSK